MDQVQLHIRDLKLGSQGRVISFDFGWMALYSKGVGWKWGYKQIGGDMKAVVVMFDSLNRHLLSPYGCDWTHTPNFKRLAERTVTFDKSADVAGLFWFGADKGYAWQTTWRGGR